MRAIHLLALAIAIQACGGPVDEGPVVPTSPSAAPSLRPLASIRLSGAAASGLAEAGGWLWVTHFEASVLSQVDPRSNAETSVVEVGANAGSVTAVGSQLWVAQYTTRPEDSRLTGVDPRTSAVVGRLQPPHLCCEVAGAAGRLWTVDPRGALLEIDPVRGRLVGSTPVAVDPAVHIGLMG